MSLIKDKSYREMPFASETPDFEVSMLDNQQEDYHQYLTLQQLIEKITKQRLCVFRCRTVGVYESREQGCSLHDIDDHSVRIRVSLRYVPNTPYAARPFTAQIFGFVHYICEIAPVLNAQRVREVDPLLAQQLCRTMKWVVSSHRHLNPDDRRKMLGRIETVTSQTTDQMETQAEQQVLQEQPQVIQTAEQVCSCLRCGLSTETSKNERSYSNGNYGLTRPHAQPVVVEEFQHQPSNIYELPQPEPTASYEEPNVATESLKRRSRQEESSVIAKKMRDSASNIWV